jgi:predicted dehydrogenase
MPEQLRFGVLSTAQIGLNRLIPAVKEASNATVVAISSRDVAKAREAAGKLGIPKAYGSYDEVLSDPDVQAVINPLPNSMHCEWTIKAAEAGKHVLCEKPLATTVAEARRMAEAAQSNGVLLMEAFTHRFNPQLRFAREVVTTGLIGEVRLARAEFAFTVRNPKGNIRLIPSLGGGGLYDAGCYAASALRFAVGKEPLSVLAFQHVPPEYGVDTTLAGIIQFEGGCTGMLVCGMDIPPRCYLEVTGTRGRVQVLHMFEENAGVRLTVDGKEEVRNFSAPNRFRVQIEHFSDCVLNKKPLEFPPSDAIRNVAFIEALKRSADAGRPTQVEAG